MNAALYVVLASLLYAVANVLIQRKVPNAHGVVIAAIGQIAMIAISWTGVFLFRKTKEMDADIWVWCLIIGAIYCAADISYFHSYSLGMKATTATTILLCVPVMAGIINFIGFAEKLKLWHYLAFVFAVLMVLCVFFAGNDGDH